MESTFVPSGATRALALAFCMVVSRLPAALPLKVDSADSLEPRSKPSSLLFSSFTGPSTTNLSVAPVIASAAESVPPLRPEPAGSGREASSLN